MRITTLLLFLLISISGISQNSILELQDHLIGLNPKDSLFDAEDKEMIKKFWGLFKEIREKNQEQKALKGSASFGFNGNNNEDRDLYQINGGINLSRGDYPDEFSFSSKINVIIDNGQLKENLTNLNMTYDRFLSNGYFAEAFTFINRRSNQFMDVDQRYETGAGIVFSFWKQDLKKGSEGKKLRDKFDPEYNSYKATEDGVRICIDKCKDIKLNSVVDADFDVLLKEQDRISKAITKAHSPLRIGLLLGVFFESETIAVTDDVMINGNLESRSHNFTTTNQLRWELRPTFDVKPLRHLVIKLRPYIKIPMPWDWTKEVEGKKEVDFRVDFPAQFKIPLNQNFSLDFTYTLFYDNAPNSIDLMEPVPPDGSPIFLTANKLHQITNFSVRYVF